MRESSVILNTSVYDNNKMSCLYFLRELYKHSRYEYCSACINYSVLYRCSYRTLQAIMTKTLGIINV